MATIEKNKKKPMYDMDIAKRFTLFRQKYIAKSQAQAARDIPCNQAKLSLIEAGKKSVDYRIVESLIKKYHLNLEWLTTGKGTETLKHDAPKNELVINIKDLQGEIQLLKKAMMIMQANQNHFIGVIEKFMQSQEQGK